MKINFSIYKMSAIIIDYDKIINSSSPLVQKLSTPPKSHHNFVATLVCIVDKQTEQTLQNIPIGLSRLNFLNSPQFISNIKSHYYLMYNHKKNICVIDPYCIDYLTQIKLALVDMSHYITLWTSIDLQDNKFNQKLDKILANNFGHPYVTSISPIYDDIPPSLALIYQDTKESFSRSFVLNKVYHALEQFKNNQNCFLYAKLSKSAIQYLKKTSFMGMTKNSDGKHSQKELTGELYVQDVSKHNNKFVYIIDVNQQSISSGAEEDVNVSGTRYNFHSHPHEAYIRHSVEKAWPSLTDFLGYHKLGTDTIFHCVATIEGVYIMSFSAYWGKQLKNINTKFIKKHYDIDHSEPYTPQQYVNKINSILRDGHPIFYLYFFPWKEAGKVFKIYFSPIGISCIATQRGIDHYVKIHN